jgi:inorganic triphosphatase YgiF
VPLETEAKLIVRDRTGFDALRRLSALGPFRIRWTVTEEVRDAYLDTADRRFMLAGYACRLRQSGCEYFITLKSLSAPVDGIAVREEIETRVDGQAQAMRPQMWPEGPARALAARLCRGVLLGTLCELRQIRRKASVTRSGEPGNGRPLMELSLDEVRLPDDFFCVEVELREGTETGELKAFAALLSKAVPMTKEIKSKFERALEAAGIPFPGD